jgi:hypothetical protein
VSAIMVERLNGSDITLTMIDVNVVVNIKESILFLLTTDRVGMREIVSVGFSLAATAVVILFLYLSFLKPS